MPLLTERGKSYVRFSEDISPNTKLLTGIGNLFLAQTPEQFTYDLDGNLLNDGRWTYTWDAENRLVDMTSLGSAPIGSNRKLDFAYDYRGRRIQKTVSTLVGSSYVSQTMNEFVYDGWNLVTELNSTNGVVNTFLWGSDLSGSMQGAGGVGGLLAENANLGTTNYEAFVAYDANGNVTELIKNDGTSLAQYEYGPFGEVIRATGPMAKVNPFRFSTQYQDDETDLLMYPYRPYSLSTGRWLSRDPIGEKGGVNLYGIVANDPLNQVDFLGLTTVQSDHWFPGSIPEDCIYVRTMNDGSSRIVTLRHLTEDDITKEEASLRQRLPADGKRDRRDEGSFDTNWFNGVGTDRDYYWVKGEKEIYADNEINYIGIGTYEAWLGDSKWEAEFITWLWKQQYAGPIPPGTWVWLNRGYDDYSSHSSTPPTPPSPPPTPPRRRR